MTNPSPIELLRGAEVYAPERLGVRDLLVGGGKVLWLGAQGPGGESGSRGERGSLGDHGPRGERGSPLHTFGIVERDLTGSRIIPGLIDGHVHITGGGGEAGAASRVPPLALSRLTASGITSVVGVLGTDDTTRTTRELLAQVRALKDLGISAWCHTGGYHFPPTTFTGSVRDDIVHLAEMIGVGELALSDHRSSQPTLDDLLRVAGDAHVAGMLTGKAGIVHLHLGDGPRGLELVRDAMARSELPPRVFNPTHVNRRRALFEETVDLARNGCSIDVTAFPVADGEDAWTAEDALLRYLDSGAPPELVTVSSDGGGCLPEFEPDGRVRRFDVGDPGALMNVIRHLLDRGQPLERILPAFTANVAGLLRLRGKGRIAVGGDADLVVLDAGACVSGVMARGRWHVLDGRTMVRGPFEPNQGDFSA